MKKLLLLLLFIPLVNCSDDSVSDANAPDPNDGEPVSITFRVQELWMKNTEWLKETNNDYYQDFCDEQALKIYPYLQSTLSGFEVPVNHHHQSIDTLKIELMPYSQVLDNYTQWFDFYLTNRIDVRPHPINIGHIEFIGFENKEYLVIEKNRMISNGVNPIIYFTSNKSEDFIDSITLGNYDCSVPFNAFDKSTYEGNYRESTEFNVTVPFEELNNNLEVNDSIGYTLGSSYGWKPLGEGWGATFNKSYKIIEKIYND